MIEKFNEVSERVGSSVRLEADDWHHVCTEQPAPGRIFTDAEASASIERLRSLPALGSEADT